MSIIIKVIITALLVTIATEVSKRSTLWGSLITSLPINSVLVLSWVYWESKDAQKVAGLCNSILLMIVPTLVFFIVLPLLLKRQLPFGLSMLSACLITGCCYWLANIIYVKLGWRI